VQLVAFWGAELAAELPLFPSLFWIGAGAGGGGPSRLALGMPNGAAETAAGGKKRGPSSGTALSDSTYTGILFPRNPCLRKSAPPKVTGVRIAGEEP